MRKCWVWHLSCHAEGSGSEQDCSFPTCCPRSCLRRGRVLHHCFFTPLCWWRIKLLLSFDAYFCFVTNSLENKKRKRLSSPVIKVCCYQVTDLALNLRTETTNALQPNTYSGLIYYRAASLQSFPPSQSPLTHKEKIIPVTFLNITFSTGLRMK